jgi:two-component system, cell cycle sensor histidine kinase and response regulator CckA
MNSHPDNARPKILLLEDNKADARLALAELARASFDADSEVVSTSKDFVEKIQSKRYDLILADYRLPDWTGLEALRYLRNSGSTTPFILLTGTLGDDLAVDCIKEGATDYVLKEKLDRLPRACRRALEEASLRAERDRAEKELRDTGEQYRLLFDANPLPLWVFDRETLAFLAVNESAIRHYGFSRDEFLNMTIRDIRPPEDVPALLDAVANPHGGLSRPEPWIHRKKDGTLIDVEITSHGLPFRGRSAELILAHDVTDQRRSEEALRQSEERFAKAFRSSPLPITISTRAEGRYLDVNDAFLKMMGYSRAEVVGHTSSELKFWLEPEGRAAMIRQLAERGEVTRLEAKIRTQTGDIRLAEISAELIELDRNACVLAITHDVTERRRLEEQLRQAQKMEAVGRLAGGIAHDFNNMLSVVIGYADLLQERVESGPARKGLDEIKKAADRAASLTRQLLAFSRRQVLSPRILDLNSIIDNLSKMLRHMIGEDIELVLVPGASLGHVKADPIQVEHAIMNLAVNARDAMPHGGKLIVATTNAELDETKTPHHPSVRSGSYVLLAVSDTGCGMSEETMRHIFEPFYTTKGPGQGTGLGLPMVYGFVNQSGGYVWVYSELGKGTTFKLFLPRIDEPVTVEQVVVEQTIARGSETVLLVEDEEPLRFLATTVLEDSGYTVHCAPDAQEATKRVQELGHIDLLVTDVVMPGQSGSELAALLRRRWPNLKTLYISGYTGDLITQQGVLETGADLLEKPFTKKSLLKRVRAVLDTQ